MTLSLRYQQHPASDILPVLTTSSSITNTLSDFQKAFMEGLTNVRQYFQQLGEEREKELERTAELCQLMDQQLALAQRKMKEKKTTKAEDIVKRVVMTEETEGRALRSKSAKNSQKRQASSATKSVERPSKVETTNKGELTSKSGKKSKTKQQSNRTLKKQPQIIQKRGAQAESKQIYICLKCLKLKKMTIWSNPNTFLTHMQQTHSIDPKFQLVLSAIGPLQLPCSHLIYRNKLTNMLRNTDNELFKQLLWMLEEDRTDGIIACGCLTFTNPLRINWGCPLFLSAQDYYNHLNRHHGMVLPSGSTHRTVTNKGHIRVVRISEANRIFQDPAMQKVKQELRTRVLKQSCVTFKRLLQSASKLKLLEFLSRSTTEQPHAEIYHPLPVCDLCERTFPNLQFARTHCTKECKANAALKADFTLEDMRSYLQAEGKIYEEVTQPWMEELSLEDRRLLNLQLYLVKRFYHCADCNKWFMGRDKQNRFLMHLYSHSQPPAASHAFAFLLPSQRSSP